jgi:hypothetical protein
MPSQIFKTSPNKEIFFSLIKKNGVEKFNNYEKLNSFVFNKASFKKAQHNNDIEPFLEILKLNYFDSKKFYVERKMTYKNFVTIIRQICRYHCVAFTSQIKYQNSKYEIIYTLFI